MKPAIYSGFDYSLDFSKSLALIRDAGFEITALGGRAAHSGHENVKGSGFNILRTFGHRLLVTHIHDNTGVDSHTLPFEGNIDWAKFKSVFHSLNYAGDFLIEADMKNSAFKDHSVFLAQAMQRAKKLME